MALNIFSEEPRYFSHYLSEPLMTVCLLLFLRWKFPLHVEVTCMFPLLLPKRILVNRCHFKHAGRGCYKNSFLAAPVRKRPPGTYRRGDNHGKKHLTLRT